MLSIPSDFSVSDQNFNGLSNVAKDLKGLSSKESRCGGVYIWRLGQTTIRVGKEQSDVHRRALAHIQQGKGRDTAEIMEPIKNHLELDLYLIDDVKNGFAIPSLEMFLEKSLNPVLPSNIRGINRKKVFNNARATICQLLFKNGITFQY